MTRHIDPCGDGMRHHFMDVAFPQTTVTLASPADLRSLREALRQLLDEIVDPDTGGIEPQPADSPTLVFAVRYATYVLAETKRFAP